jgi:dTDP-4-dehydrorhamnose 3,5-epimerase
MQIETLKLDGPVLIRPRVFADERGFFLESYHAGRFAEAGLPTEWAQDNHSRSARGILRGLHYQSGVGQGKLVRCVRGAIWDVWVDIRPGSPTFGQWDSIELNEDNHAMIYIPVGFAHGYTVLSESADCVYKCTSVYNAQLESGIAWNDPEIAVAWPVAEPILSLRDQGNPSLREYAAAAGLESAR